MRVEVKNRIIIILSIGIFISFFGNIIGSYQPSIISVATPEPQFLVIGVPRGPATLDPIESWEVYSHNVIDQVGETLFSYNLTDPNVPVQNLLAESYEWIDDTILEITVKQNIIFHDGEPFNAQAAAWNIDRLIYLMNHTGEMPMGFMRSQIYPLFEFPDGTPYFNHTEVIDDSIFKIYLNSPFAPILSRLAYSACSILSPASTPFSRFLDKADPNDLLIGTGPYVFENYIADKEVNLLRWDGYWRNPVMFEGLEFKINDQSNRLNYAMISKDIDYLIGGSPDLFKVFNDSPYITLHESQNPSLDYNHIRMNTNRINITWRKSISYAVNYSNLKEVVEKTSGISVERAISPFSSSSFGYDPTVKYPIYNLTHARELLMNMGFGDITWNNSQWESGYFLTLNYTYSSDVFGPTDDLIGILLAKNLKQIGINLTLEDTHYTFLYSVGAYKSWWKNYNSGDLVFWNLINNNVFSWRDPLYWLEPYISNVWFDDLWINQKLSEAILESNITIRLVIFSEIQHYLTEDLLPFISLFHPKVYSIHAADLYNVKYNVLNKFYAYPIKRNLRWSPY